VDKSTWYWIGGGIGVLLVAWYFLSGSSSSSPSGTTIYSGGLSGNNATTLATSGLSYALGTQELSNQLALGKLSAANTSQAITAGQKVQLAQISQELPIAQLSLASQIAQLSAQKAIAADYGSTLVALQPSPLNSGINSLSGLVSSFGGGGGLGAFLGGIGL
jgi:hypothetical protein